ncbi:glycosyltransferase family 4 protein [Uliginosibacterium aquaticum]|uniref:Glycosyltransferase family 4 protein n=1 Tax=Uliginosibacterium aquaticum TaxID=2731212 RepID=A0ABX2IHP4_9RHOO|nr:glycosyltransferase family 4 protein [Uliginosibacterium aquaticum]NSL55408.1 glycosyltransferase family 4 protein [Uliginosibacterium aquaticum]
MKRILIAGWRGVSHSFAMVNQHQILALARHGGFELFHRDMPWFLQHWNARDHASGFSAAEDTFIMGMPPIPEEEADCVYRICSPLHTPGSSARRTISYAITELGYQRSNLQNPDLDLSLMTTGENLLTTPTRWSRDRLLDFGFAEDKIRVVRHGVDLATFSPLSAAELASQRAALGIPSDAVVFLNVGVPTWNKGIDLLVRAFALAHQRQPNIRLILKDARALYGLPVDSVLQQVAASHPGLLSQEVLNAIMVVSQNLSQGEMRLLYGIADHYVSPYRAEGFNLPVLEAQACGTPVIVSSGGATDDFCDATDISKIASVFRRGPLRDNMDCCWVDPDFSCLQNLVTAATLSGPRPAHAADPLRQAARRNAEQHSWDRAIRELIPLLQPDKDAR